MGHLNQHAGAVPGVRVPSGSSAMAQVDQDLEALFNDLVGPFSLYVGNDTHTAGVMLLFGRI